MQVNPHLRCVDTMNHGHNKRQRPDSLAPIADSTGDSTKPEIPPATAKTTAAAAAAAAATPAASGYAAAMQTQDLPRLPEDAYSTLGKAGAESQIFFDSIAECEHDSGKWKQAMA